MRSPSAPLLLPLLPFSLLACASAPETRPEPLGELGAARAIQVELVGDVALLPLDGRGLEALSPRERVLAWHLAQVALAAHPVALLQNYRYDLPIWDLVQGLLARREALDPGFAMQLADYRRRLFLDRGVHDAFSEAKFVPAVGYEELSEQVRRAATAGARLPGEGGLQELRYPIFDVDQDRYRLRRTPGPAGDPLAAGAVNHYAPGLGIWDLVGFRDRFPRNSRVVREGARLVEQVYRAGEGATPAGLGARELAAAARHLEAAMELAGPEERRALASLVLHLRTGDSGAAEAFERAWVGLAPRLDWVFGFLERSSDPRQVKGLWMGAVAVRDPARDALLQQLVALAPYFEERMPWAPELRRSPEELRPPAAAAVSLLAASGQALGPGFTGLTLPADPRLMQRIGSRSWVVVSADEPEERLRGDRLVREFVLPEVAQEAARCRRQVAFATAAYREVLGHPSGKLSPGLKGDPREALAPYYSMLEEARARAVALYQLDDPATVVSGMLSDGGCQSVAVQLAAMEFLTSLATVPRGTIAEDDRLRATLLIQGWLVDKEAVEISVRGASRYARVVDHDAWRAGLASLLAELQRDKATADRKAVEELVERYATRIDPTLRDEVLARMRRAALPARLAALPPVLEPVKDAAGKVIDARARPARSVDDLVAVYEQARRPE